MLKNLIIPIVLLLLAVLLSVLAFNLKPIHDKNEKIYNKRGILTSIENKLGIDVGDLSDEEIERVFTEDMEQIVIDLDGEMVEGMIADEVDMAKEKKKAMGDRRWPVYIYEEGAEKYYIISVRGQGLWDEIWGSIALEDDLTTLAGVEFDHTGETPGLGAEIKDNANFKKQFIGKKIYDDDGNYTSVLVRKGGAKDPVHEVDAISGATVTCDGVTEMLERGIKFYEPYFEDIKDKSDTK